MKKNSMIVVGVLSLTGLFGCKQNPFSSNLQPGQRIVIENPNQNQTPKVFSIEAPDMLECTEGAACGTEIRGHVPEPGQVMLTLKGLPDGANYDPVNGLFSFTPGFDVVDVANHPEQSLVVFPVEITVRSSDDPVTVTTRVLTLIVKNKMQDFELKVSGSDIVYEGETLEQKVEVNAPDFPQGPFNLVAAGAPAGTEVIPVAGTINQFTVKFTPGFNTVPVGSTFKTVNVNYVVPVPAGQALQKKVSWRINDQRQNAAISAPETMTEGLDVSFSIRADDLNGEAAPRITVDPKVPFGRITTSTILENEGVSGVSLPSKVVMVRWDQLKVGNIGTTTPIRYEVCVQKYSGIYTQCIQKSVKVTLRLKSGNRLSFESFIGRSFELKKAMVGEPWRTEWNPEGSIVRVSLDGGESAWNSGMLFLLPQKTGIQNVEIVTETDEGDRWIENFQLNVMNEKGEI